jgi:flagellar basal-body rod protein FlgF
MPYGLYLSAEGANVQSRRLDVLANNMANVATPGFKRDVTLFQSRFAEAVQQGQAMPGMRALDDMSGGVKVLATATDFSQGPLASTKNDTDMAVQGDAFFVVRQGNKDLLTRAGNFLLTAAGRLVTQDGKLVLSVDGNPIDLDPDAGPWQLTPDGQISQAGESVALALVRPRSYGDLVKVGENLFAPLAAPRPVPDEERQVLWHQVEQSTVRPSAEMMELIEASRAFEANVNLIHTQDEMLSALVTRALRTE